LHENIIATLLSENIKNMEESYFGINEAANTSPEPLPPKLTKHNRRNYQPLNENTSPTEE
jgi:hypothetical protein